VQVANFDAVRQLAHAGDDSYALGIHPLYVAQASRVGSGRRWKHSCCATAMTRAWWRWARSGWTFLCRNCAPAPCESDRNTSFWRSSNWRAGLSLPVLLHVRRSVDQVLKRACALWRARLFQESAGHAALRGSASPMRSTAANSRRKAFVDLGLKLGFGGALTYARASQLRRLAALLPLQAIVLETDAPDMPPRWLYKTAGQRAAGELQGRNEPGELPRIGSRIGGAAQHGCD
jgi:TatD DNase family protein